MVINSTVASMVDVSQARTKMLQTLGRIFSKPELDTARKTRLHQAIGERGQQAVLNSYAQVVTARKRVPSYRIGSRYAGGALQRAISSSNFFRADGDGLQFINAGQLDTEAKQWHRLNFGAGRRASEGRTRGLYQIRWGGLVAATIGLDDGPSGPVFMPSGFWVGGGEIGRPGTGKAAGQQVRGKSTTSQMFMPTRGPARFGTAGIAARRFLDTGVREIAKALPLAYQDYYREIFKEAKNDPTSHMAIHLQGSPSPRPQKVSVRRVNY